MEVCMCASSCLLTKIDVFKTFFNILGQACATALYMYNCLTRRSLWPPHSSTPAAAAAVWPSPRAPSCCCLASRRCNSIRWSCCPRPSVISQCRLGPQACEQGPAARVRRAEKGSYNDRGNSSASHTAASDATHSTPSTFALSSATSKSQSLSPGGSSSSTTGSTFNSATTSTTNSTATNPTSAGRCIDHRTSTCTPAFPKRQRAEAHQSFEPASGQRSKQK